MSKANDLFTEKFRPKNLKELIAPERVKSELNKGLVQNLLLYGTPGTGKTSTLFILAEGHESLYINASSERGIDTIRETIPKFCSTMSLTGGKENLKCVILDEIDGATDEFYKALRGVMERYASTARFIASCNYLAKIPKPVYKSRFHNIAYDPINNEEKKYLMEEYMKRIAAILKAAKIEFSQEILLEFVKNEFPDMRSLMNKVQSLYLRGVEKLDEQNFNTNFEYKDLFNLCLKSNDKPYENYKVIVNEYGSRVDESLSALGSDFPDHLRNVAPDKVHKLPEVVIAIAEYQYQKSLVIDPLVTLLACCYKIQQIMK